MFAYEPFSVLELQIIDVFDVEFLYLKAQRASVFHNISVALHSSTGVTGVQPSELVIFFFISYSVFPGDYNMCSELILIADKSHVRQRRIVNFAACRRYIVAGIDAMNGMRAQVDLRTIDAMYEVIGF